MGRVETWALPFISITVHQGNSQYDPIIFRNSQSESEKRLRARATAVEAWRRGAPGETRQNKLVSPSPPPLPVILNAGVHAVNKP